MAITLTGKQQEVLALPAKGHIVVLGTAGSGKTTIALHRARHLANIPGSGRILLVTFNRALVEYMKGIDYIQSSKLTVENYHRFARGYLNARGKMPKWNGILSPEQKECYIGQALEKLKVEHPEESTLKRPREFFVDEITFIERFGFNNLAEYREAERIGRASSNIKRENRKWIYAVYEEYQTLRQTDEPRYDWDDLALYVFRELQEDDSARRYTHIIVDEGQDFSPMMIKSLVAATARAALSPFLATWLSKFMAAACPGVIQGLPQIEFGDSMSITAIPNRLRHLPRLLQKQSTGGKTGIWWKRLRKSQKGQSQFL